MRAEARKGEGQHRRAVGAPAGGRGGRVAQGFREAGAGGRASDGVWAAAAGGGEGVMAGVGDCGQSGFLLFSGGGRGDDEGVEGANCMRRVFVTWNGKAKRRIYPSRLRQDETPVAF